MRKCGKCGLTGHNARTCKSKTEIVPGPTTLSAIGHQILDKEKIKVERIKIDGIKPLKGMWICNKETKRVAGQIQFVKHGGSIVWKDYNGVITESNQKIFLDSGYSYCIIIPPGIEWTYLHCGVWDKDSVMTDNYGLVKKADGK